MLCPSTKDPTARILRRLATDAAQRRDKLPPPRELAVFRLAARGMATAEIARAQAVSPQQVSNCLGRLAADGYLRRTPTPGRYALTARGGNMLHRADTWRQRFVTEAAASLSSQDRLLLRALLRRMVMEAARQKMWAHRRLRRLNATAKR